MGWFAWLKSNSSNKDKDSGDTQQSGNGDTAFTDSMRISGPFTSDNLSLFLIHNEDMAVLQNFMTLEEALEQKKVVVKETSNVQQLLISNVGEELVFIQSGDIVMGGKQDRALQYDMLLTPKSGFLPINSFCVEQGRWRKRGKEDASHFNNSSHHLSSKRLKMAAKYDNDQAEVWRQVEYHSSSHASNLQVPLTVIQNPESPSSLPLMMEHETVQDSINKYINELAEAANKESDVVGYAFAINGKIKSIRKCYACSELFKRMWSEAA